MMIQGEDAWDGDVLHGCAAKTTRTWSTVGGLRKPDSVLNIRIWSVAPPSVYKKTAQTW